MDFKKARKFRDAFMIIGFIMIFVSESPWLGIIVMLSCIIPDYLYNRCPHCNNRLGRNAGKHCHHCGGNIE